MLTIQNICNLIPHNVVVFNQNYQIDYVNEKYSILDGCYSYNEHWLYTTKTNRTGHDINKCKPVLRSLGSVLNISVTELIDKLGVDNDQKLGMIDQIQETLKNHNKAYRDVYNLALDSKEIRNVIQTKYTNPSYLNLLREMQFDVDLLIDSGDALDLYKLSENDYKEYMEQVSKSK